MTKTARATANCVVDGCDKINDAPKGYCAEHYRRLRMYGTTERQRRPKGKAVCSVDGCSNPDDAAKGLCQIHYHRLRKNGTTDLVNRVGNKRSHPLYSIWFEKKSAGRLCDSWDDLWVFVADVGERPSPSRTLIRLDRNKPFGPDNFEWAEHLRKRADETRKEWFARKWASRRTNHPDFERLRELHRKYGLSDDDYAAMVKDQGNVCAICSQPESIFDSRSGSIKRLAVDHCHDSGKIRGLLCFRCNSMLGRIHEDVGLLLKMVEYLSRHNPPIGKIT